MDSTSECWKHRHVYWGKWLIATIAVVPNIWKLTLILVLPLWQMESWGWSLAFLVQASTIDELPERLIGAVRISHLELSSAFVPILESDSAGPSKSGCDMFMFSVHQIFYSKM
ncbi:unnamed protein product [Fraxinus pennsylvanica]|uniref:Protein ENHANCED DISEASE RESISTANCE 2 C-terminal domain-containing protein n=1 Tax=Fraxinus pennsylvanica TaxID=56036 RepID=A0AAD1Z8N9_9LAMI|nr:unnamed protein product [Fraxinus pennsylvanica]